MGALAALGVYDFFQTRHSLLRNYPIIGRFRYLFESIRPELQQYFVEPDTEGKPYPRTDRSVIYERAKLANEDVAFGTELDVMAEGYEWMAHSIAAKEPPDGPQPRVTVGGDQCSKPYEMALLNVSAMSFGSLSSRAIEAMNRGATRGGFAHDTGEGGISDYHLNGGDLVWEIGSGYFGCRTDNGRLDEAVFRDKASHEQVKCISVKLSQGAKPGRGGVMPARKVTAEIAEVREVPEGEKCVSPPSHPEFETPVGLLEFVAKLRELSGGKPTGFKLCFGSRIELLAIIKAMLKTEIRPDFIIVDGAEGGTGAGPFEFSDRVGMPLRDGLLAVQNALVGVGIREQIRVGASGKVSTGFHIARLMALGADYTNAARAMMMSIGCIQTQECHLDTCPVGVATQDPTRIRALNVERSATRCFNYQRETVRSLSNIAAAHGLDHPGEFTPQHMMRRINETDVRSFAEIYEWLDKGELLEGGPESWAAHWQAADPSRFVSEAPKPSRTGHLSVEL
ncbi:MAG: FMN-binding glutamate synthase family protein [Solirubrobacterales bacterium]|nr:FMN-binding glutamate synthase family protein [Solirubrobacterales bacterium]